MHKLTPFIGWRKYYDSARDELSPFFGKTYNYDLYSDTIYGYYIDPDWDFFGTESLYLKISFADYHLKTAVIEFIGEWNDTIHNDVMHLKRNVIDHLVYQGIKKFIIIGESVFNFHGSDDSYYEEWFDEVEEGWIVAIGFPQHVLEEMTNYQLDYYINWGDQLEFSNWRTFKPQHLIKSVDRLIQKRLA